MLAIISLTGNNGVMGDGIKKREPYGGGGGGGMNKIFILIHK